MTAVRQLSFAAGEVSPEIQARTDTTKYAAGLATCRNMMVKKSGGLDNRAGTQFLTEVKDSTKKVRLIDFVFNDDQAYVVEMGHQYLRILQNGALLRVSGVVAWNSGTAYTPGDVASHSGVNYVCILSNANQQPPNATYWYALTADIYELPTPYVEADLAAMNWAQTADIMVIVHRNYAPRELARFGALKWSLSQMVFGAQIAGPSTIFPDGGSIPPWHYFWTVTAVKNGEESTIADAAKSLAAPTPSVPIGLSWTAVPGADHYRIYRRYDGGAQRMTQVRLGIVSESPGPSILTGGITTPYGFIGTTDSTTFTDNGIEPDYDDIPPENPGLFSNAGDYPGAVTFSQQSLYFGGTDNAPETVWRSKVGFFRNFLVKLPITDDVSMTFRIVGNKVNRVRHLIEMVKLLCLTSGGEWAINGDQAGVIRPTAINAAQQSHNGTAFLRPIPADFLLYLQARGSVVRGLDFDVVRDGYDGDDLTIFSSHLFLGHTVVDWTFQRNPSSIVWAVRDDGVMLGFTFLKKQEMEAWHRHDTDGIVENVCCVPEGTEDALYLVVRRTINGSDKRYIERMNSRNLGAIEDAVFMDCAKTYDGAPTKVVTGLSHLEGKAVSVLADGFVVSSPNNPNIVSVTVTGGQITLGRAYSVIQVGLPYVSDTETLNIDAPGRGTLITRKQLVTAVALTVENSRGIFAGQKSPADQGISGLREYVLRNREDYTSPVNLVSGNIDVNIPGDWKSNGRVFIRQIDPIPLTILSIVPIGEIGGS